MTLTETAKKYYTKDVRQCTIALEAIGGRRRREHKDELVASMRNPLKDAQKLDNKNTQGTKNMLLAGALLRKWGNTGKAHPRHVYVSKDMHKLCWKDPKKPNEEVKFFKKSAIKAINKGRSTPQLETFLQNILSVNVVVLGELDRAVRIRDSEQLHHQTR